MMATAGLTGQLFAAAARIPRDPICFAYFGPPTVRIFSYFLPLRSRGAVVSAALSERKVAGSIPTIGDFHTVGPCKKAVFACLATDVK